MIDEKKEKQNNSNDLSSSKGRYVLILVGERKCLVASDIGYHGVFVFSTEKELKEKLVKKIDACFDYKQEFMVICKTKRCVPSKEALEAMFSEKFPDNIYFEEVDQANVFNCNEVKKDLIGFSK